MLPGELSETIKDTARACGFDACGIARAESLEYLRPFYREFFSRQREQSLTYLKTNLEKRLNPALLLPGVQSVIAVLLNYFPRKPLPEENRFILSRYSYGSDYHVIMKNMMKEMVLRIKAIYGAFEVRFFVDSGVVAEKVWAQRCGLGWQGKNTLLIHPRAGSFFFIGILLTDLSPEPDEAGKDHCGNCDLCIRACPVGALDPSYQLNPGRCLSYHTIESDQPLPEFIKEHLNHHVYGCDICQEVCPCNRFSQPHRVAVFEPDPKLRAMTGNDFRELTPERFEELFKGTAIYRAGYHRMMRNIRAAEGNGAMD